MKTMTKGEASIEVLRTRSDWDDCFYPLHDWPTQKKELTAMMDVLKSGQAIDDSMRAKIGEALWLLYAKLRAENIIPTKGRPASTARLAGIAARLLADGHTTSIKAAIFAAIPGDDGARLYPSVETTLRAIRRGKTKAPTIGAAAVKAAAQRLTARTETISA